LKKSVSNDWILQKLFSKCSTICRSFLSSIDFNACFIDHSWAGFDNHPEMGSWINKSAIVYLISLAWSKSDIEVNWVKHSLL
jgi:hypothetical protein